MEITFIPRKYGEQLSCEGLQSLPAGYVDDLLEDIRQDEPQLLVKEANYGRGADWIWIYVVFNGIIGVLALGDKINKGIDGWVALGKKLKKLIRKVDRVCLDKDALTLLCLHEIIKTDKRIEVIAKVVEYEVVLENNAGSFINKKAEDFVMKVEAYYIFSFLVNENTLCTFSSDIHGNLKLLERRELSTSIE